MIFNELIQKVRRYTRDTTGSLFSQEDIADFCNEGIERIKQVIPIFKDVPLLKSNTDEVEIIPVQYQHLISVYSASRCFSQDEQQYQASTYMNEFESKLDELLQKINGGEIVITDKDGNILNTDNIPLDNLKDVYFKRIVGED